MTDYWKIRDVDPETRKRIKRFALDNDMKVAQALKVLARQTTNAEFIRLSKLRSK